jgi:hypothetical protein
MARPKENDFKRPVKDQLAKRVAYRCSKPDCRKPTIGPKANSNDADSVGRAAHICAASVGGPRYDASMTSEKISSFENGIWLCANHASEIDSNNSIYSVELLTGWKKQAEQFAEIEKGNKLPSKNDAVETLLVAMGESKKAIPSMIENIHRASSVSFEQLDPRFGVKSSYINQQSVYEIYPKENVSFNFNIQPKNPQEFMQSYSSWINHGENLEVDTSEIDIEGSQLLKEIFNQKGKLTIGAPQKDALVKIWTVTSDGKEDYFDSLLGKISIGKEGFKFKGLTASGFLEISINRTNFEDPTGQFNLALNLEKWEGVDVTMLAYFDKVKNFFDSLSNGNEFFVELEIEGNRLFSTKKTNVKDNDYFKNISFYLVYTNAARVLANYTNQLIRFKSDNTFSAKQYADLLELQRIAEGKAVVTKDKLKSEIICEICFESQDAIDAFEKSTEPSTIKYGEISSANLSIFDQELMLPPRVSYLHPVILRTNKKNKKFRVGQTVKVEVVPLDGFRMTTYFESVT